MRAFNVLCVSLFCIFPCLYAQAAEHIIEVGAAGALTFDPPTLTIDAGDTVTWHSPGGFHAHNVVGPDGAFRCAQGCDGEGGNGNPSIEPWTFTRKFSTPGTVDYYCELHGVFGMTGSITVNPAPATTSLTGLWWNPNESGWGIHFTHRRNILFAAWYTYDDAGSPKWYVASSCAMPDGTTGTSGTCNGTLYSVTGPAFFGTPFDSTKVSVKNIGTLQVAFQDANNASMTWVVNPECFPDCLTPSQTRTVGITRQVFAAGATPAIDYSDLWWNPNESGWGLAIAHEADVMFLAWYVYDGTGKPLWYVASNCAVNGNGCSGTLYRTTGPPFATTFDPTQVHNSTVGTVTLNFSDSNNGILSYTVNGTNGSKTITRQLF